MRRIVLVFAVCILYALLYCAKAYAQYTPEGVLVGDIDGNGVVTVADAVLALRFALGLASPTLQQEAALPKNINPADSNYPQAGVQTALMILRVALGLDSFPPETAPVKVTDATFERIVLKSRIPVLVDFYAQWCGWCQKLSPVIEALALRYSGRVRFAKLDVDANPRSSDKYGIRSVPTMILFKNGQQADKTVGYAEEDELADWLEKRL